MTSARNQVYSDEIGSDNFTFSHSYQQWKRPDQLYTLSGNPNTVANSTSKSVTNSFFNHIIDRKDERKHDTSQPSFEKFKYGGVAASPEMKIQTNAGSETYNE